MKASSRLLALIPLSLVLAGCTLPLEDMDHGAGHEIETGLIAPGEEKTVHVTDRLGRYELHCDPHPWMEQELTIRDGGEADAHVHILDGDTPGEYRFDPVSIVVTPGGNVTYHNHGKLPHTASEMTEGMNH